MAKSAEKRKIEQWLRRQVYSRKAEGTCERIELRHLGVGKSKGQDVQSWDVPRRLEERELVEVAESIDHCAQEDCNGMGSLQRYQVLAFFVDEDAPKSRLVFRKHAETEDEEGEAPPEE